jgi:hypothetical protein
MEKMKRHIGLFLLAVMATLLAASTASAQRMIGAMPKQFLLLNPKIQAELKLTDSQKDAIKKAAGDSVSTDEQGRLRIQMTAGTDIEAIKSGLKKAITPAQDKRLTEIWIQRDGVMALSDADVSKQVGLTDEQKKKVADIFEDFGQGMQELIMSSGGHVGPEQSKALRDKTKKQLEGVLTASQKTKFQSMKGAPFKIG